MTSVNLTNPSLVTGRVGELVDYANDSTYKVVQKIFGYNGPYRKVLHRFGIGTLKITKDFLALIEGRIYTDIATETEVLWKPCSYRLRLINDKVVTEFHFYGLISLLGFFKKTATEVLYITFIDKYLKVVDKVYKDFSEEVEKTFDAKTLTLAEFLILYESVVFVSYLYELMFNYNNHGGYVKKSDTLRKYVAQYDFMLSLKQDYAEFVYKLPQDFVLGATDARFGEDPPRLQFIPCSIPNYEGQEKKEIRAEAKLQCIKNNMRLKTNILLYFLNETLYGGLSRNRTGV